MQVATAVRMAMVGVIALVGISACTGSFYSIDQGDRGVILRNGRVIGEAGPGMGFKMPFFDDVKEISVQSQKATWENVPVYSQDQQTATIKVSINYHATDVQMIYSEYKTLDGMIQKLVSPQVPTRSEAVFGTFSAAKAVQERGLLNTKIAQEIKDHIVGPFVVESIQVENVDFDDTYENAIRQQMQRVVELRAAESVAAKTRMIADADAYAAKMKGEGEAAAIRARGEALRENPGIPALVVAEKWDGSLPTTMVPGSAVPFLGVK